METPGFAFSDARFTAKLAPKPRNWAISAPPQRARMLGPGADLKTVPAAPQPAGTGPLILRWPNAAQARASGTGRFAGPPKVQQRLGWLHAYLWSSGDTIVFFFAAKGLL